MRYKDTYNALKSLGWIKDGKFVRVVIEVLADMEFISKTETAEYFKTKPYPKKLSLIMMSKFKLNLSCARVP